MLVNVIPSFEIVLMRSVHSYGFSRRPLNKHAGSRPDKRICEIPYFYRHEFTRKPYPQIACFVSISNTVYPFI